MSLRDIPEDGNKGKNSLLNTKGLAIVFRADSSFRSE